LKPENWSVLRHYRRTCGQTHEVWVRTILYIDIKGHLQDLKIPDTNLWIYPNEDYDANLQKFTQKPVFDFPVVYISFPSRKDPDWEKARPGKSTIEVVVPAPYAWFAKWKDTPWQNVDRSMSS
jgi:all-trans-retinol 13,14-reductase